MSVKAVAASVIQGPRETVKWSACNKRPDPRFYHVDNIGECVVSAIKRIRDLTFRVEPLNHRPVAVAARKREYGEVLIVHRKNAIESLKISRRRLTARKTGEIIAAAFTLCDGARISRSAHMLVNDASG